MSVDRLATPSYGRPLATRAGLTLLRIVGAAWTAVIVSVIPGIEHRRPLMLVLLAFAGTQYWLCLRSRARDTVVIGVSIDLTAGIVVGGLVPALWDACAFWLGGVLALAAIALRGRVAIALGACVAVGTAVAGTLAGIPDVRIALAAALPVWCALIVCGHVVRRGVAESEADLIETVTAAGAIVAYVDLNALTLTRLIGDVLSVTGYSPEVWGTTDQRLNIHPDDLHLYPPDVDFSQPTGLTERTVRYHRGDDTWAWHREVSSVHVDEVGRRTLRGLTIDVTEFVENREQLIQQARTDLVTGLPNRLALLEQLDRRIRGEQAFALAVIDLDNFKAINDTLGHEAGDFVLRMVGSRIQEWLTPADHVSRLGGDEFAILFGGSPDALRLSETLSSIAGACSTPMVVRGVRLATAMSAGVVFSTRQGDRDTMLRHADIAMYASKRASEPFRFFDSSLERTSTMELSLSASLSGALSNGEIRTHFQPQYDLFTGQLVGAEALIRWHHPSFGVLSPQQFLEIAQLSDHATAVTERTAQQAIAMIATAQALGHAIPIAVNVSSRSLFAVDFASMIRANIERYGVDPTLLTIEITEGDALPTSPEIVCRLAHLSSMGVRLSIDDFGTGHSSLARLRALTVDELKIDQTFVSGMLDRHRDRVLVQSIIELAALQRCRVVAEGVELPEQAEMLRTLGCRVAQGYLFGYPCPGPEFVALLASPSARRAPACRGAPCAEHHRTSSVDAGSIP